MIEPIAYVDFTDGTCRPVFEEPSCRQHVIEDDGEPVYGTWIFGDEPVVVVEVPE